MIKFTALFACLLIPALLQGQNYFKEGTVWTTRTYGTHLPSVTISTERVTLGGTENVDGVNASKMYRSSGSDGTSSPLQAAYVRQDGDRIYARSINPDRPEWYLMYDFGLREGEGSYFYAPGTLDYPSGPLCTYIKCIGIEESSPSYNGWDIMNLEEYEDSSCALPLGKGVWIKGLSSARGVMENICFEADGNTSELVEAVCDKEVIYTADRSGLTVTSETGHDIRIEGLTVTVAGMELPDSISLHTLEGGYIDAVTTTSAGQTTFHLPSAGVYLLTIGRKTVKIYVPN